MLKDCKISNKKELKLKSVLFQAIQISVSTQFCATWPRYKTLPGATTSGQTGTGIKSIKGYFLFPKALTLLECHHQIVYCHIQDTRWGGGLNPLHKCSRCIQQHQSIGLFLFSLRVLHTFVSYTFKRTTVISYSLMKSNAKYRKICFSPHIYETTNSNRD